MPPPHQFKPVNKNRAVALVAEFRRRAKRKVVEAVAENLLVFGIMIGGVSYGIANEWSTVSIWIVGTGGLLVLGIRSGRTAKSWQIYNLLRKWRPGDTLWAAQFGKETSISLEPPIKAPR